MRKLGVLTCGALILAACVGATPEAAPIPPTPFPEIATTPELETWATSRILSFREAQADSGFIGLGLQVLALPAALDSAEAKASALVVSSVEPPGGWFATPLGQEPVVFVVNPDNPLRDLTVDEVSGIFTGRIANWQELDGPDRAIQPIVPLAGAETRSHLQQTLLGDRRFTSTALLGPNPDIVLTMVQDQFGAIGIVPLSAAMDASVVTIDGLHPTQAGYPWQIEIMGMAPAEPAGIVREWLTWLQAQLHQES